MAAERKEKLVTLSVLALLTAGALIATVLVIRNEQLTHNPAAVALQAEEGTAGYTDLAGNPLSLTDHIGKILVVNSWASWSPDSATELVMLAELAKNYEDGEVKVIAINRGEPQTTAERFLRTIGAADGVELVLDLDDRYYRSIGGYAMPETIVYDTRGTIISHHRGVLTREQITAYIETAAATE